MTKDKLPERHHPRLKAYDYGAPGCYFVTICTKDRRCILSRVVGRGDLTPPRLDLTTTGKLAAQTLAATNTAYPSVRAERYVVMPNHVHVLYTFAASQDGGVGSPRPTLQTVVKAFKAIVTRGSGQSVWQASFYDVVVRNDVMYQEICRYIDENPVKWQQDKLYCPCPDET